MREQDLEKNLTKAVHARGGLAWKFVSPGTVGVPDRIVILPKGHIAFIELKKPGTGKLTKIQAWRHHQLKKLSAPVFVINHPDQIEQTLNQLGQGA